MATSDRSLASVLAISAALLAAGDGGSCAPLRGDEPLAADARSTELLRYECSNELGRRDVTLFANGTVRLREGLWENQALYLDELLSEELASYLARFEEVLASADRRTTDLAVNVPSGSWVDACEIRLALPGREPVAYDFSAWEVPPLVVAGLVHVAEDLAEFTRPVAAASRLPADYEPRPGDVLRSVEGERFRVVNLTIDGRGLELEGVEVPLRIFVALDQLGEAFAALEKQGGR